MPEPLNHDVCGLALLVTVRPHTPHHHSPTLGDRHQNTVISFLSYRRITKYQFPYVTTGLLVCLNMFIYNHPEHQVRDLSIRSFPLPKTACSSSLTSGVQRILLLEVYSRLTLLACVQVPFLYIFSLQINVLIWHEDRRDVIITYNDNQALQIYSRGPPRIMVLHHMYTSPLLKDIASES